MSVDTGTSRQYRLRGAPIIHDTIDNETIAINQQTGAYYSLEGPAARVWEQLADGGSAGSIAARLADELAVPPDVLAQHVARFLDELHAEQLIVAADGGAAPAEGGGAHAPAEPSSADRPASPGLFTLQRYTDLEVMLLADPIHEVDETGWPMPLTDRRE
jgi:hypothetical protein